MNFTINGTTYKSKTVDFNMICDLEDMGLSISDMNKKSSAFMRGYFALCSGLTVEQAGIEMQAEMINGGDLTALAEAMTKEITDSDFFRAINKTAEKKTTKNQK